MAVPRLLGVGVVEAKRAPAKAVTPRPLAVLGGAFDPPHNGHLWLARRAAAAFSATVRLLPNGMPPHRSVCAPFAERLQMCRLAVAGCRHIEVGDEERPMAAGGKHYTVNTLQKLRRRRPRRTLLLVVGADSFNELAAWHCWRKLFEYAHLVVMSRAGVAPSPQLLAKVAPRRCRRRQLAGGAGGVYFFRCRPPAVSSTAVRAALGGGGATEDMLPAAVRDYALARGLYKECAN